MPRVKKETERIFTVAELRKRLNDKFGAGTALTGDEVRDLRIEFFSTGCFALDITLRGGLAYNRIGEIIGSESSCKTSLMHLTSQEFLRENPKGIVVHADLENTVDFGWMRRLGCNLDDRYLFLYADSGEQAGDLVDDVLADREIPVLLIVDSIMAMTPLIELESTMDSQFMGKHPALINRLLRVANSRLKAARVGACARASLILVNQTRPSLTPFTPPIGSSGGEGRKFFASQRIMFTSSKPVDREERGQGESTHKTSTGKHVQYQVIKNKCGGPEETGHFMFYNRPCGNIPVGMDNADALLNAGMLYGLIKRRGAHYVSASGEYLRADDLRTDPGEMRRLRRQCIEAAREEFTGDTHAEETSPEAPSGQVTRRKLRVKIGR